MSWTWIRPAEPGLLDARPLLDLGCGDGQTVRSLAPDGMVVCLDRSLVNLRAAGRAGCARLVGAEAQRLPLAGGSFASVLAADLFHHLDEGDLLATLREVRRVLRPDGRLYAWWFAGPPRHAPGAPDAPRHSRAYAEVAQAAVAAGMHPVPLEVKVSVAPAPPTDAMMATPATGSLDGAGASGSSGSTS